MPDSYSYSRVLGGHRVKDLETRFSNASPSMIETAINLGITRLSDLFISGAYGDVYGYWCYPKYFGYFTYNISDTTLNLDSCLSTENRLKVDVDKYNPRFHNILDDYAIIGNLRMPYLLYGRNVLRIKQSFNKSLWPEKIQELKNYKTNPLLEQEILILFDRIVMPEI